MMCCKSRAYSFRPVGGRVFIALCFAIFATRVTAQELIGPLEYSSFNLPASGVNVSPFSNLSFLYLHLEDFEDGLLNTPGVTVLEFATTNISTAFSDSVDGDDGVIDGVATGNTSSLFSNLQTSSFTFEFDPNILGEFPTHAGVVWTDIGRNNGGTPFTSDLVDNTFFEAFDNTGASIGLIGPVSLGDTSISRTTEEDRFFGVVYSGGISAISISMPGKNNWEIDHLQYGRVPANLLCDNLIVTVDLANGDTPTAGDDVILGTSGADFIDAGAGDDTICGLGGADTILAGGGADYVEGGNGADQISGEGGNDTIFGGSGGDEIDGGGGDDEIFGEAGNDVLIGRTGEDLLDGGAGVDSISGGPQADTIFTGSGATVGTGIFVSGGGAGDTIFGGPDADDLRGAAGADTIHGDGGDDVITGGVGLDELFGGGGDDIIRGQASRDDLFGGAGNDDLAGGAGDDDLDGGAGIDFCAGQSGTNDTAINCEAESTIP